MQSMYDDEITEEANNCFKECTNSNKRKKRPRSMSTFQKNSESEDEANQQDDLFQTFMKKMITKIGTDMEGMNKNVFSIRQEQQQTII